jgi:hypothetical protein
VSRYHARVRGGLITIALAAALVIPAGASASYVFGDRGVQRPTLTVNRRGVALVTYRTQSGLVRHILAWGAVNAVAHPKTPAVAQQAFRVDYSGGWKSHHDPSYWKTLVNACRRYDGPALPFFVAGCKAPDGSYWALQSWQRNLPMRGYAPWTPAQRDSELHLSHWSGPLPVLDVTMAWTYQGEQQGFFGRLLYQGEPVYGTRSPSATVSDPWARNISIDTLDSSYGPGWKHATQVNTHPVNGGFCYTFVPQPPPAGYPSRDAHGNGLGTQIRVEAMGPGVTPIVAWVGSRLPGLVDQEANAAARARFDAILGGDKHCAPERP